MLSGSRIFAAAKFALRSLCMVALLSALPSIAHTQDRVSRGRYFAAVGDCEVCHTALGSGARAYAGGLALHARFGTVYSSNITPDPTTGIGRWTTDQFYRALHRGIGADGRYLYPAFPYPYFATISRQDSDALFSYLKTLKPIRYASPANQLVFPTNIRAMMVFWNALFLNKNPPKPDNTRSAQWKRGADIVNGLGHCGGCHTPKTFFFSDQNDEAFQGTTVNGWFAANLTGSSPDGLGRWSAADIVEYLKTGGNRFGRVTGSMQDVVRHSTSLMTDDDRSAIAVYLKSLPPAPEAAIPRPDPRVIHDGQAIFVERCSVCHQEPGSNDYPSLAGNSIVQARDPDTVLRVIVQGSQSAPTPNGPVGFSMPAFPVLTDDELADVATYIRNAWGNRAASVSSQDAGRIRKSFEAAN